MNIFDFMNRGNRPPEPPRTKEKPTMFTPDYNPRPALEAVPPTDDEKWQTAFNRLRELCRQYLELSKDEMDTFLEGTGIRRDYIGYTNGLLATLGAPTQRRGKGTTPGEPRNHRKLEAVPTEELRSLVKRCGIAKAAHAFGVAQATLMGELGHRMLHESE